jgi:4-amino-4-deoxy-L-arabinose transferase-like glycosyltransferase
MRRPEFHRFSEPLTLLLLAAICYAMFFHGLSDIGLIGPDEPRYAAVAREMYQTGDYITPRLHGVPWFEKPVLMYWGAAISFAIFGVGEFGARFPSAFGATLTVFFVYYVCRRLWGRPAAISAAIILASSVGYFAFARAASMDMPLTVCLTMALLSFLMGDNAASGSAARRGWFFAFYAFLGFGVLAKGPVAILLPALSLFGYLFFRGRLSEWREWHPKYAWIILAIAGPWYLAVTSVNGWEFIRVFLIDQNFARFTSTVHGHQRPFYFYIPDFMFLTFPWTFLLIPAFRRAFDRSERLLVWWAVVPIVFFSLSGSKLPGYILPSVPAAVMLIAREIPQGYSQAFKIAVFIQAGTFLFIGMGFGLFGHMLNVNANVDGFVIMGVATTLAALLAVIALWLKPPVFAGFNLIAMILAVLVTTSFVLPRFEKSDTMRPWTTVLPKIVPDDQTVFLYRPSRWMEYGMQFYRFNKTRGVYSPEELMSVLGSSSLFFLADEKALADLGEITGIEVRIMETVGNQTALWIRQSR